jgi:hypothetical protein
VKLRVAVLMAACVLACRGGDVPADDSAAAGKQPGSWMASIDTAHTTDSCSVAVKAQLADLDRDTLSDRLAFSQFPAVVTPQPVAVFDPASSRSAREFRTKLREALETTPVNFAGHYSIVGVGMTGWGTNYWIVDRLNGRAVEFPYDAVYLEYSPASTLLVMDSKERIIQAMSAMSDVEENCAHMGSRRHAELRPFYFTFANGRLQQIAARDTGPPLNRFWTEYFGN